MSGVGRLFGLGAALLAGAWVFPSHADQTSIASAARAQVVASDTKSDKAKNPPVTPGWNWNYGPWTYIEDLQKPVVLTGPVRPYTGGVMYEHVQSMPLEVIGLAAGIYWVGVGEWQWGEGASKFNFHSEKWFGQNTASGGTDKLGHAWTSAVISDFITWRLNSRGFNTYESALTGAFLTSTLMLAIEVGDGFSPYGFSYEDLVADFAGVGFSFLGNTIPGFRERFDFRMEYRPTGGDGTDLVGDYSGKKFLLATKLAGFDSFKNTPLRYVELHAGYFTHGFSTWEIKEKREKTRHPYVGLGINLSEALFSQPPVRDSVPGLIGQRTLRYIQVPYTYLATDY